MKQKVLYVDDEDINLVNLKMAFSDDFEILAARSGRDALAVFEREPDLAVVLADQRMPGITGVELLAQMRQINPAPVRIVVTAYLNVSDVLDAINRGNVYHYVLKPWDEPGLRILLHRACDAHALSVENVRLAAELSRKNLELEAANVELEGVVDVRTAELRAANDELLRARDELEARVKERSLELAQTYRQLLHAEKLAALGRLSASIAHEFNNPICGVKNVLSGLRKAPGLEPEERRLAELALGECDRVARLLRDLQSFNRPTSDVPEPVDLRAAVDAMLLFVRRELSGKKIRVEKSYAADLPPVPAVSDQVRQVVLNLLENAVDAIGPGGGTVRIAAEAVPGAVRLCVGDSGAGIAPEHLDRVFEPFFTTKAALEGSGLGLSISRGIVERHGGTIEVVSEPGAGTTFTVTLPLEGRLP